MGNKLEDKPKVDAMEALRVLSDIIASLRSTVDTLSNKQQELIKENEQLKLSCKNAQADILEWRNKYNSHMSHVLSINRDLRARMSRQREKVIPLKAVGLGEYLEQTKNVDQVRPDHKE